MDFGKKNSVCALQNPALDFVSVGAARAPKIFSLIPYKNKRKKRFPAGSEKMGANGPKMKKP